MTAVSVTTDSQESGLLTWMSWICLFLALGLYGLVHLGPKWLNFLHLWHEYETNQQRLVSLENQVQDLEKMALAFERDPHFAEAVARIDFPHHEVGVERLPVDPALSQPASRMGPNLNVTPANPEWYEPALRGILETSPLYHLLLGGAALCGVLAFVPMTGTEYRKRNGRLVAIPSGVLGAIRSRYYKSLDD